MQSLRGHSPASRRKTTICATRCGETPFGRAASLLNWSNLVGRENKWATFGGEELTEEIRLDALAESLSKEAYTQILINLEKARTVWVATIEVEISRLKGKRKIAIVMNAATFEDADDLDYFITNVEPSTVTPQWVVDTYQERNWVEVLNPWSQRMVGIKRISNQRN